jgi:hypothetical protein
MLEGKGLLLDSSYVQLSPEPVFRRVFLRGRHIAFPSRIFVFFCVSPSFSFSLTRMSLRPWISSFRDSFSPYTSNSSDLTLPVSFSCVAKMDCQLQEIYIFPLRTTVLKKEALLYFQWSQTMEKSSFSKSI